MTRWTLHIFCVITTVEVIAFQEHQCLQSSDFRVILFSHCKERFLGKILVLKTLYEQYTDKKCMPLLLRIMDMLLTCMDCKDLLALYFAWFCCFDKLVHVFSCIELVFAIARETLLLTASMQRPSRPLHYLVLIGLQRAPLILSFFKLQIKKANNFYGSNNIFTLLGLRLWALVHNIT